MEKRWVVVAWMILAIIHMPPAAVLMAPELSTRLYGVEPHGTIATLITHRGALFLTVMASCLFAAFDPASRRLGTISAGISVVGFLLIYLQAGLPDGPLRTVALVDSAALVPLAFVVWAAWRPATTAP
ncbi:hypothetical protein [Niveispirillum lacus]|nr:hypothetical protein [Niveispirillum lacus]